MKQQYLYREQCNLHVVLKVGALMVAVLLTLAISPWQAAAQTFSVIYSFKGGADAGFPLYVPLVPDGKGNLIGTSGHGGGGHCPPGNPGCGTVYAVHVSTGKEKVLYKFAGGADGSFPAGGVMDQQGNFYGTTSDGGAYDHGRVFKLSASGTLTTLWNFTGGDDGAGPFDEVTRDRAGNLYGTAGYGGNYSCSSGGCGTIFKIDAAGNFSVLYTFSGMDGANPAGNVVVDAAGNLYGTTQVGGGLGGCSPDGCGTLFKLDSSGNYTVLHSFSDGADGGFPARIVLDIAGNLFGGICNTYPGEGEVFRLDPAGNFTELYTFQSYTDGGCPEISATDNTGSVYGTTVVGGAFNQGIAFKVDSAGNKTTLYDFTGGADGGRPIALMRDPAGNLYGTAQVGGILTRCIGFGNVGCGVVFKITPQ